MSNWKYDFNCRNCGRIQYVDDGKRKGLYCVPTTEGKKTIHADDDYVVRCDDYQPMQTDLFGGEDGTVEEDL